MNIKEFEIAGRSTYERLASVTRNILLAAIKARPDLQVQHIQHRAKSLASLRRKLKRQRKLSSPNIETFAKDLAGCRAIFYTNSDVSAFLKSQVIYDNFEIDWDRTKIHHPSPASEEAAQQFISNNYVVKLKSDRAALPEYADVANLWCEIQVQTALNHAWAEMAHDTIYKRPELPKG